MSHLSQIDSKDSEVEQYLQKVLRNGLDNNAINANTRNEVNGTPDHGVELRTPRTAVSSYKC